MIIVKNEFTLALNQVASERGISVDDVIESMQAAILAAFHKEHPEMAEDESVEVRIDKKTGETHLFKDDADITPPGFGRIAAQTARQVIVQKIREVEKKTVISHYQDEIGNLIKGRVIRKDFKTVFVDIGKAQAVLPREEQMKYESYNVNDRYVFYLKEISEDRGYSRIVVSRAHPQLVAKLFEREVPEVASKTVEIKVVVREPGERAKIAVHSTQPGVDPVGACVGQKGIRVQTVTNELNGVEKIDIIQWNEDPKIFITSALSPAEIEKVKVDLDENKAEVTVQEAQAPLAIGRGGVNVNLAGRLTGFAIDIIQIPSEDGKEKAEKTSSKETSEGEKEKASKEPSKQEVPEQPTQEQPSKQEEEKTGDSAPEDKEIPQEEQSSEEGVPQEESASEQPDDSTNTTSGTK
ncbi:transcription termination factor NusA [Candidatus Woesebacteria bacterium]|nr:transcription termination factor NusA [Candidatus Woesebacteria bacterium]